MLESILAAINIRLSALGHFSKIFSLAEMVHKKTKTGDQVFPAVYNEKGNHSPVLEVDKANGLLYHRKNGNVVSTELEERINRACDIQVERRYPMRLVAVVPRSILKTDNAFIDDKIAENICNSLQQKDNAALNTALKTFRIKTRIQNQSTDRYEIMSRETKGFEAAIDFKYAVIAIDYEILIEASASCFEKWDCNDTRSDVLIDLRKVSCENINDPVYGITDVRLAQCGRECDSLCDQISDATAAVIVACFSEEKTTQIQELICNLCDLVDSSSAEDIATCIEDAGAEKLADVQALICDGQPDMTANFSADNLAPKLGEIVTVTDLTDQAPTHWSYRFGVQRSILQNPTFVAIDNVATDLTQLVGNAGKQGDVEVKAGYITPVPIPFTSLVNWTSSEAGNVTKDGGNIISATVDRSGSGNPGDQPTTTKGPTWLALSQGGRPAIQFIAAGSPQGDFLPIPGLNAMLSGEDNPMSFFAVVKFASDTGAQQIILSNRSSSSATPFFLILRDNSTGLLRVQVRDNAGNLKTVASVLSLDIGVSYAISVITDGLTVNAWVKRINGGGATVQYITAGDINVGIKTLNTFVLGASVSTAENLHMNGTIQECYISNGVESNANKLLFESYVTAKYAEY